MDVIAPAGHGLDLGTEGALVELLLRLYFCLGLPDSLVLSALLVEDLDQLLASLAFTNHLDGLAVDPGVVRNPSLTLDYS